MTFKKKITIKIICSQVHEKSILLVTLPVLLYFPMDPLACLWFLQVATFSMAPLLQRDGLLFAAIVLCTFYLLLQRVLTEMFIDRRIENYERTVDIFKVIRLFAFQRGRKDQNHNEGMPFRDLFVLIFYFSLLVQCVLVAFLEFYVPPSDLPDIIPVLISSISCCHFLAFLAYFNFKQLFGDV